MPLILGYIFALSDGAESDATVMRMQGIWEQSGYGNVYVIEKDGGALYQYTRETCLLANDLDSEEFNALLTDIELRDGGRAFTAISSLVPAFRLQFSRLTALPETCSGNALITGAAPRQVFEHLWHTFNDYYAFFVERGVDWRAQYAAYRQQVDDKMSDRALFAVLTRMLSAIDDGHISLVSQSKKASLGKLQGADAILAQEFHNQSEFSEFDDYEDAQLARYNEILFEYLDENSVRHAGGRDGFSLVWGTVNERVGYLRIQSMESIATDGGESPSDDIHAVGMIMDQALRGLRDTDAMIIDVRLNDGGNDAVSLAIASHFTETRQLAMTKTARSFLGETAPREAYLVPRGGSLYGAPVAVIAGPNTVSAAEVFVLAMRTLPQVIQVGEPTNGILSDELTKSLPNGWIFTLSNEVYYDLTGASYEVRGIPPHIEATVFSVDDLEAGRDSALEAALKAVRP